VRAPGWAIDYNLNYRRAKTQFKKHLMEQGIPKEEANELAKLYPFKIRDIIETARSARELST
jgi:hypothetical protein